MAGGAGSGPLGSEAEGVGGSGSEGRTRSGARGHVPRCTGQPASSAPCSGRCRSPAGMPRAEGAEAQSHARSGGAQGSGRASSRGKSGCPTPALPLVFSPVTGRGHVGSWSPGLRPVLFQKPRRVPQSGPGPMHRLGGVSLPQGKLRAAGTWCRWVPGRAPARLPLGEQSGGPEARGRRLLSGRRGPAAFMSVLGGHMSPPTPATTEGQLSPACSP